MPTTSPQEHDPSRHEAREAAQDARQAIDGPSVSIRVARLRDDATLPTRAHPGDSGLDLYPAGSPVLLAGRIGIFPVGFAVAIPAGHVGKIEGRSSLAAKGVVPLGGIIDHGYTGEVKVVLANLHPTTAWVATPGDAIAQLVIYPIITPAVVEVDTLGPTDRGAAGFGSTDRGARS
jgi:dUTP pyrophosphatase